MTLMLWHAPFLSSGGYCSEAISFAQALSQSDSIQFQAVQHGDSVSGAFVAGLSEETRDLLSRLFVMRESASEVTIVVCHSEPGAWSTPRRLYDSGSECPPKKSNLDHAYRIGRTMFETDRLPNGWLPRLQSRARVGVDLPRTSFIDRQRFTTVFCFVGKWEARKNVDTLVRAFVNRFAHQATVALAILTQKYHNELDSLPVHDRILFFSSIDERHLPGFFAECTAFVTATHGEGFGRPIVEAMSMSLPVIAPLWSGMTEYLTSDNSFPVPVSALESVGTGSFADHQWATVDETLLSDAMFQVFEQPELARLKGLQARIDVIQTMSLEAIARKVEQRINQIRNNLNYKVEL